MIIEFNAFHQTESNFFSLVSYTQADYGNLVAYATGVQVSGLNPAIVNRVDDTLSTSLATCKSFYAEKKLPWALVLPEYLCDETTADTLKQHQLTTDEEGEGVAMIIRMASIEFPPITSPLITREMHHDLDTWSVPLLHGFESTPEITEVYTKRHQLASQKDAQLYHFSGFINDVVICSLTLSVHEGNARLDDVATMPAFQKKGFATELMYAALKQAKELNIKMCLLEASRSGLSVYKRMGFKELFVNNYYEVHLA